MSSVTLMHPTKAVGQNEMPFGKDTSLVPSNVILDRGPGPPREGGFRGKNPQFTATPFIARLLTYYCGPY